MASPRNRNAGRPRKVLSLTRRGFVRGDCVFTASKRLAVVMGHREGDGKLDARYLDCEGPHADTILDPRHIRHVAYVESSARYTHLPED